MYIIKSEDNVVAVTDSNDNILVFTLLSDASFFVGCYKHNCRVEKINFLPEKAVVTHRWERNG